MRLLSIRAVDGVRLGVQTEVGAAVPEHEVSLAPAVPDPKRLDPRIWVNDVIRQDSNTAGKVLRARPAVNPT